MIEERKWRKPSNMAGVPVWIGLGAVGWKGETPLWFYILRGAATIADGDRLGPVGGPIVAEVIVTLLDRNPGSLRNAEEDWHPRQSLIAFLEGKQNIAAAGMATVESHPRPDASPAAHRGGVEVGVEGSNHGLSVG